MRFHYIINKKLVTVAFPRILKIKLKCIHTLKVTFEFYIKKYTRYDKQIKIITLSISKIYTEIKVTDRQLCLESTNYILYRI